MVLNLDNDLMVDVDRISLISSVDSFIIVDGTKVKIAKDYLITLIDAFKRLHQTHIYNKELKREGGK